MTTMLKDRINLTSLEETLASSTPFLAVVGAGDLAVEKLRAAREEIAGRAASFDPKAFRDQAQTTITERVDALQAELLAAPEQLRALPERAQEWPAKAQSLFADVVSVAFTTYGELAGRGKQRVTQVRGDLPGAVDVEVDVTPVSRPTTSPTRKSGTATKRPAEKASAASSATAKPAAARKHPAKKAGAKKATSATKTTGTSAAKRSAAKAETGKTSASTTS